MKYINDIHDGENIIEHFLCKNKQLLKSRSGKSYLSLKLQDKTGVVDAKVWDLNNNIKAFEENEFVKIDGRAITYQNEIQINIKKIRRSQEGEYNPYDYIPSSEKNIDEMAKELLSYISTIKNHYVKKLLEEIFINNHLIVSKLKFHSAAKNIHHSYMGGLVEHTLSVTQICDFMSTRYKYVDRDILIASAMLHDICKIYELSDFPENDYTDDGQLLGHIIMGVELISDSVKKIEDFPKKLENLLKHCLISHHGEYEYGSPQLPKTMEAFILHYADNMDAKIKIVEEMISNDTTSGNWVGYQKLLQRNIRKSDY